MAIQSISTIASKLVPSLIAPAIDGVKTIAGNIRFGSLLNQSESVATGNNDGIAIPANGASSSAGTNSSQWLDQLRDILTPFIQAGEQLNVEPDGFGGIQLAESHPNRVAIESAINGSPELVDEIYRHWDSPEFSETHELDRTLTLRF